MGDIYSTLAGPAATYVNSGSPMTVASLLATYPAAAGYKGLYARVSDLWGGVDEIMRCSYDGVTYYWRPQRTDYAVTSAQTTGALTLTPLVNAPEIAIQSTLLGAMTLDLSATNAWPGCQFMIRAPSSLGIFGLTFTGLIGGATSNILGGADKTAVYTAAGWRV